MTNAKHVMTLFVRRRKALQIERDSKYPQMWRVRLPDGTLTDMVNLTRAKDAALDIAEGIETRKTPHKSPLKSLGNFSWSWSPVASNERFRRKGRGMRFTSVTRNFDCALSATGFSKAIRIAPKPRSLGAHSI